MKATKTNSFKEFYMILKTMPGYSEENAAEIKEQIVSSFTEDKTTSLREMSVCYPADYSQMMHELRKKSQRAQGYGSESEKWRRRVIAAICSYLDRRGQKFDSPKKKIAYAVSTACRAAGEKNFNRISVSALQRVYNTFGFQKSLKEIDERGYENATIADWTEAVNDALVANNIFPSKMNINQ